MRVGQKEPWLLNRVKYIIATKIIQQRYSKTDVRYHDYLDIHTRHLNNKKQKSTTDALLRLSPIFQC